jgi:outer membrane protein assembly factor BamB
MSRLWVVPLLLLLGETARADDWPQWLGPNRDGVWRETGVRDRFPADGLKVHWRTPLGGGYAGPAVAGGKVFVTDRVAAPAAGPGRRPSAGKERVLCLEEQTGRVLWTHEDDCTYQVGYPAGPRTTPVVRDGKVYTLGAMGDLLCLDAETGQVLWSKNFPRHYGARVPQWGFAAHPLADGDRLLCVVGGEGSVAVAFHKDTGKELWRALSARGPGYCPPMIYEAAGKRQLIVWHPEAVNGLDPETGAVYWSVPFAVRQGISIATPRLLDDLLFVSCFYDGALMLRLRADRPGAGVLWKGKSASEQPRLTDALHCLMSTPFLRDGHVYGVCSYGELRCLKADTGERLWETSRATGAGAEGKRWANAFLVAHQDRFFLFNENGDLINARLTPKGYEELDRAHLLDPSNRLPGRPVVWSHPAFANRCVCARNDREIVCVSLAAE